MPPNVLIVMTDQQRADAMGCTSGGAVQTPCLDRLAAEGTRFDAASTTSPLCMPARASLMTGIYPHNHTVWENPRGTRLSSDIPTLFRLLQQSGYFTAHIGKGHYYHWDDGMDARDEAPYIRSLGFDHVLETTGPAYVYSVASAYTDFLADRGLLDQLRRADPPVDAPPWRVVPNPLPVEAHLDSFIGRCGVDFLQQYDPDRPFCLFLGFGGPHDPWDAPGEYATMYDPANVPAPIPPSDPAPWLPPLAAQRMLQGRLPAMTEDDVRGLRANYFGKITLIDHWVGQLMSVLDHRGWSDDTLVVFLSDHGEMAGDHGRIHKVVPYESSVRIPLIIRWPGSAQRKQVSKALVETTDILPTILEAAGLAPLPQAQGRSLWPVLRGEVVPEDPGAIHDSLLSEVAGPTGRTVMLRTDRHKYAVDGAGKGLLLHDLGEDPQEQRNLLGHPEMVPLEAQLRERLFIRILSAQPSM